MREDEDEDSLEEDRVDGDDGSNWIGAECCGKLRILSV